MEPITLTQTKMSTIITVKTTTETVTEPKEGRKLFTHPVRHVGGQKIQTRKANFEPMQSIDCLHGKEDRNDRIRSKKEAIKEGTQTAA